MTSLAPVLRRAIAAARRLAREEELSLYLACGALRDLFLRRPVLDVDLVIEGDAMGFGRRLARGLRVDARVHERFATATLALSGGARLDIARSRRETYERPGALPRVEPAPIQEDLKRRDFTINAMALELAPGARILDPFGGKADLKRGVLRMLHPGSSLDDPTRAFRAARYANRLSFRIEPRTRGWIAQALARGAFDSVSGARLSRELRLLFSEKNRAGALRLLLGLGLDRALDPALPRDAPLLSRVRRAERLAGRHPGRTGWLLYLLVWAAGLEASDAERLSLRLALAGEEGKSLRCWPSFLKRLRTNPSEAAASRLLAEGICPDEIGAAAVLLPGVAGRRLERAFDVLETRLTIRGRDLLAAGVPAGPRIGRALKATLSARRDGKISGREELAFALRAAQREVS